MILVESASPLIIKLLLDPSLPIECHCPFFFFFQAMKLQKRLDLGFLIAVKAAVIEEVMIGVYINDVQT